jgi:ribosomal silencing factor RsfS
MSKPQLLAVLSRIEDAAAEHGLQKQNSNVGSSQWELLDFGSIVCHVFTAEQREFYNLDDFYALAEEVDLPFVSATAAVDSGYDVKYAEDSNMGGLWSKSL